MTIRPYAPAFEDGVVALMSDEWAGFTEGPVRRQLRQPDLYVAHVVASVGATVVGAGAVVRVPNLPDDVRWAKVRVRRDRQRCGIGAALWTACAPAIDTGASAFVEVFDHDHRAVAIGRHWGFEPFQHTIRSELELDRPGAAAAVPHGVSMRRLVRLEPSDVTRLDAFLRSADDSPEAVELGSAGLEGIERLNQPVAVLAVLAVRADDGTTDAEAIVGVCVADVDGDALNIMMTATDPEHRGAGIARAAKQEMATFGRELGVRRIETWNEAANTAIRALNASLGYHRREGMIRMRTGARRLDAR